MGETMYAVRLFRFIGWGGCHGCVLEYTTGLPFPPVPGIGLGLHEHCDLHTDHLRVKEVMWLVERREFLVRTEEFRVSGDGAPLLAGMCNVGWRPRLDCAFTSREEAAEAKRDNGDDCGTIVSLRGEWHLLSPDQMLVLRMSGEPFEECPRNG